MVMMESFSGKSKNFMSNGQIAIALKDTLEAAEIKKNIDSIGYILFHVRKDEDKHLFLVNNPISIFPKSNVGDIYMNMRTAEEYLLVNFSSDVELSSSEIHPSQAAYTSISRYDPQYVSLDDLMQG